MKRYLLLTILYLALVLFNVVTMVLHPDLPIKSSHIYISTVTVMMLLYAFLSLRKEKKMTYIYYFESGVVVSGILIYIVNALDISGVIYGLVSILFAVFISPLYGFNAFIKVNYETYSLFLSIYFLVVMLMTMTFKKEKENRLR